MSQLWRSQGGGAGGAGGAGGVRGGFGGGLGGGRGDLEKVKDATDIVRLIGEHVKLTPKGREYVCLCPFHDDHNPSMCVVPGKQIYHCFVCGAGGDCFSFVKNFLKMEFREALEYLAGRAGIELTPMRKGAGAGSEGPSRSDLKKINEAAAAYFQGVLAHAELGRAARAITEKRGLSADTIAKFRIGAAADRWDGLAAHAKQKGLAEGALKELGLVKARESGSGVYDAMRNRLIFPIWDATGAVIAFGGRRINEEDNPKYLNSPDTRLFKKSGTLYALHLASRAIQETRTAIITEGYMDAIACHQAGVANAVATLGTALTREHAAMLRRLCDRVVLLFDGDEAGQRAADRAVEVFFAESIDVGIASLSRVSDAKDPDELLRRPGGVELFRACVDQARDLLEFRFDRLREKLAGAGLSALSSAVEAEIGRLVELGLRDVTPVRRRLIEKRLAELAGVDEDVIRSAIPGGRSARVAGMAAGTVEIKPGGLEADRAALDEVSHGRLLPEEFLLGCVLCDGGLWLGLDSAGRAWLAGGEGSGGGNGWVRFGVVGRLARAVEMAGSSGERPDLRSILAREEDEGVRAMAVALMSRVDRDTSRDPAMLEASWRDGLSRARAERERAVLRTKGLDPAAHLEALRQLGGNPRSIPRPPGGVGGAGGGGAGPGASGVRRLSDRFGPRGAGGGAGGGSGGG